MCNENPTPFMHFSTPISYRDFESYMQYNIPCSFGSWISSGWISRQLWVRQDGRPNLNFLEKRYGTLPASVTKFSSDQSLECMSQTISEFISYWKQLVLNRGGSDNKSYESFPVTDFHTLPQYLKDWHFSLKDDPSDVYFVPELFSDDWLNRFWKSRIDIEDDYIFSYFGPAGSFTPFHADVFRSYSWSINVCGRKKWLILYPGEENKIDHSLLNIEDQCKILGLRHEIVVQDEGEGIFIPSGWWHQVLNMADTISINHNWANFHCIPSMWNYVMTELSLVESEISDVKHLMNNQEWNEQCQIVLHANIGINYKEFLVFLLFNLGFHSMTDYEKVVSKYNGTVNQFVSKYTNTSIEKLSAPFCPSYSSNDIVNFLDKFMTEFKLKMNDS